MKKLILIIIISGLFISCYIADNNSDSGSITINLSETMKDSAANQKLVLKFFNAGEMSVNQTSSEISYLSAEYPDQVSVTGVLEYDVTGESGGSVTVTGIPSGRQLELLAEYKGEYSASSGNWHIEQAGLSDPFEVEEGGNTTIDLYIVDAKKGTIEANHYSGWDNPDYFRGYTPEDLAAYVNFDTPYSGQITTNSAPNQEDNGSGTGDGETITFTDAVLPGKQMRIMVSDNSTINEYDGEQIGISDTFEILPGQTKTLNLHYYYYTYGC